MVTFEEVMEGGVVLRPGVTPYLDMIELIKYYPLSIQGS